MNSIFIFPNDEGHLTFVYPAPNCGISIEELARKDVPAGKPYLIVPDELVPKDHTFFEAFQADFTNPDGYGIGYNAWFIEQYEAEIATLDPVLQKPRIDELNQMIAIQQAEMQQ